MSKLSPELAPEKAELLGIHVIKAGRRAVQQLKDKGARQLYRHLNQYGEVPIRADKVAEGAMYAAWKDTGIPVRIEGEELGIIPSTVPGRAPKGLVVFDGIDGSSAARKYIKGSNDPLDSRFAIMVGIAATPDPLYQDFSWAGSYEYAYYNNRRISADVARSRPDSVGRLVYGTQDSGAYVLTPYEFRRLNVTPLNEDTALGPDTPGYYLEYGYFRGDGTHIERYAAVKEIPLAKTLSSASHGNGLFTEEPVPPYALLQPGAREHSPRLHRAPRTGEGFGDGKHGIVFYAETGRKGMEEWPINYRIGHEAGAVFMTMIDNVPTDLGTLPFRTWSRNWFDEPRPAPPIIVAARNQQVAEEVLYASHGLLKGNSGKKAS